MYIGIEKGADLSVKKLSMELLARDFIRSYLRSNEDAGLVTVESMNVNRTKRKTGTRTQVRQHLTNLQFLV